MSKVLLVVQKNDHSLGCYDPQSGESLGRVALDPYPHEFAVSADGRRAYCCHFGVALAEDEGPGGHTVSVVDIAARRRVLRISVGISDLAQRQRIIEDDSAIIVMDVGRRG